MDKQLACHDIAMLASKMFVDSNSPEYVVAGYSKLVEDLTTKYIQAYEQSAQQFDALRKNKVKTSISKSQLGL